MLVNSFMSARIAKKILQPNEGNCCVFCSYGKIPSPPIQENKSCNDLNCC